MRLILPVGNLSNLDLKQHSLSFGVVVVDGGTASLAAPVIVQEPPLPACPGGS